MSRDLTQPELEDFRTERSTRPFPRFRTGIPEPFERSSSANASQIGPSREVARPFSPSDARIPDNTRAVFHERDRAYRLRESERHTLAELGMFRLIPTEDLRKHAYQIHPEEMKQDIRNLLRQGLIRRVTSEDLVAPPREMLTLTQQGYRLVRPNRFVADGQLVYHGFPKFKEADHDADIYRLYQKAAAQIEAEGGTILRVVLQVELQKNLKRDLAIWGTESRHEIASRYGLQVVGEKIPIPDLRVEYQTPEEQMAYRDLELITEHYRRADLAEKVSAGFSLYARRNEADRLRRALDRRGLTAGVLSL
jgi:hypothetical protein